MTDELTKEFRKREHSGFEELLKTLKKNPETLHFKLEKEYFFLLNQSVFQELLQLHEDRKDFDHVFESFSSFGKERLLERYLVDEVLSTNEIEGIASSKEEIFRSLRHEGESDQHIVSSINAYKILTEEKISLPKDHQSLRELYDLLIGNTLKKEEEPDGVYYRRDPVYLTDGLKPVHTGIYPEEKIIACMEEIFTLNKREDLDIFERILLSHFLFETIHPYYDGNGRLGRFLMSLSLYEKTHSCSSFLLSSSIRRHKKAYYKAFEKSRKETEQGYLVPYVISMAKLLHEGFREAIEDLRTMRRKIEELPYESSLSKSENTVWKLIRETSILSSFGICNEELLKVSSLSLRSISSAVKKLKELGMTEEERIGKYIYRRAVS